MTTPELRCDAHRVQTRLTCARCGVPICPQCLVRTDVGLRCDDCGGQGRAPTSVRHRRRRAGWLAAAAILGLGAIVALLLLDGPDREVGPELVVDDERVAAVQAALDELAEGIVGGTVAVVDTPEERLTLAAGHPTRGGGQPLTGVEAFRIGSITKPMTATVALQLVEAGRLSLDEPVARFVPDQAGMFEHGEAITLRHLLGHTSGLPEFLSEPFIDDVNEAASVDDEGVVAMPCPDATEMDLLSYAAAQPASFEPGERSEFTHTNYLLAGAVVEAVTGKPLDEVFRERIFGPLDMDSTWMPCADEPRAPAARGYDDADLSLYSDGDDVDAEILDMTEYDRPVASGTGGLMATARDLVVFGRALVDGELFEDEATLEVMLEPHPDGPSSSYGLGLQTEQGVIGHWGAPAGYDALLRYYPSYDTVVVALTSQPSDPRRPPASRVAASQILKHLASDRPDGH